MDLHSKKIARIGMYTAAAMLCSYIETLVPLPFGVPGMKLGLANLVVVLVLYRMGAKEALLISVLRIVLTGFLFGNLFGILYSLAGGILSFFIMWLLKKSGRLGCVSVSTAGGISHNIGQLLVAAAIVENYNILYYIPVLLVSGFVTGFVIGILAQEILVRNWEGRNGKPKGEA